MSVNEYDPALDPHPRRVLLFSASRGIPLHGPSGASAHLRGLARGLAARGHAVRVATPLSEDARGRFDAPLGLPVVHAAPRSWRWMGRFSERGERWDARRLAAAAAGPETDVIIERYSLFSDAGLRLARAKGCKLVLEVNAPLSIEQAERYGVRDMSFARGLEREVLRGADRVAVVSPWLASWAVQDVGCDPARVVHVPNGMEMRRVGARHATRAREGLSGLVVVMLASMQPWHGLGRLPELVEALPEASFVVLGSGPDQGVAHERVRYVRFAGPDVLPDWLAAADVGLAPYTAAAPPWLCPLKLLDYRAAGLPAVSTDVGEAARLIGEHGELLAADAPAWQWAAAVRRAAERQRMPSFRHWFEVGDELLAGL